MNKKQALFFGFAEYLLRSFVVIMIVISGAFNGIIKSQSLAVLLLLYLWCWIPMIYFHKIADKKKQY